MLILASRTKAETRATCYCGAQSRVLSRAGGLEQRPPPQLRLAAYHSVGEEGSIVNQVSRHSSYLLQLQQLPRRVGRILARATPVCYLYKTCITPPQNLLCPHGTSLILQSGVHPHFSAANQAQ